MKRAVIQIDNRMTAADTPDRMGERFVAAWNSGKVTDPVATFVFNSPAQLFSVISPKRWN